MKTCAAVFALAACALGQPLAGVIDIHAHCDPDAVPRSIDAIDLARLGKERGMRGMVLKSHYEPTATLAYVVRKAVPGIEIFGGIDLNLTVGGLNPAAVERMATIKGGWGRVIWMPTFDAENQVRFSKENRPFVPVSKDGRLLPAAGQVIGVAVKHHLLLETGHSSAQEGLLLIREARRQGLENIVVTHAMLPPVSMSIPQMQEAAKMGAYIEFVYNALIGPNKNFEMQDYVKAIREVGPASCILASDLGQAANPLHPDGLAAFFTGLRQAGIPQTDIDRMAKVNPAKVLGLPAN